MHYFSLDGFSFGGLLEYILQHALAKFQPVIHKIQAKTHKNTAFYSLSVVAKNSVVGSSNAFS